MIMFPRWLRLPEGIIRLRDNYLISDYLCLFVFYCLLVGIKLVWVQQAIGPYNFDEYFYKGASQSLFLGNGYTLEGKPFDWYPPLYSLVLIPAFLSSQDWYLWLLRINVLISSTLIYPVWWIARTLLPRRESWFCVVIAALMPYHLVFPRSVLSENLFVPLFLLAFYTLLWDSRGSSRWVYLATGAIWGLCYLTRHAFFAALPVLLLAWWLQPWITGLISWSGLFRGQRLLSVVYILLGVALVYLPWPVYAVSQGAPVLRAMGIGVGTDDILVKQQTLDQTDLLQAFLLWVVAYLAYLTLMSAPYLHLLVVYPFIRGFKLRRQELFFVLALVSLTGTFTALAIVVLWLVFGNRWEAAYLEGRYVMYGLPLLPILGFMVINQLKRLKLKTRFWVTALGISGSTIFVYSAYMLIISQTIWPWHPFSNNVMNSIDSSSFHISLGPFSSGLLLIFFIILIIQGLALVASSRYTPALMLAGLIIFYGFSDWRVGSGVATAQEYYSHGKRLVSLLQADSSLVRSSDSISIFFDQDVWPPASAVAFTLAFWGIPGDRLHPYQVMQDGRLLLVSQTLEGGRHLITKRSILEAPLREPGLFITRSKYPNPLLTYQVAGSTYHIYAWPIPADQLPVLSIVELDPSGTVAGRDFNLQPGGDSAILVKTQNATAGAILMFKESSLSTTYSSPKIITALMSKKYYTTPGTYPLYLFDPATQRKSNTVEFVVTK